MPTILIIFILCSLITTIVAAMGKCPLWISNLLIVVTLMIAFWPK